MNLEELSGTCQNGFKLKTSNIFTNVVNSATLSKAEYFKLLVNIDKQLLKSAAAAGNTLNGLSGNDHNMLDLALHSLLNQNITDSDIDELIFQKVQANLNGMGFSVKMPKWVNNAVDSVKATATKAAKVVEKVVKKAVDVVHKAVTFPSRIIIKLALKLFKAKVSKAFIYAFVPDNSPLMVNPEVKRKSARQKEFIRLLSKGGAFPPDYLMKHIRNDIQATYSKTPEQVIEDLISKKDKDLKGIGVAIVDDVAAIAVALAPIIIAVPAIVKAFNPKKDTPSSSDIVNAPPSGTYLTDDPTQKNGMSTAVKAGIAIGGLILIGGGIYVVTKKNNSTNK
jgi:hypothetical protein